MTARRPIKPSEDAVRVSKGALFGAVLGLVLAGACESAPSADPVSGDATDASQETAADAEDLDAADAEVGADSSGDAGLADAADAAHDADEVGSDPSDSGSDDAGDTGDADTDTDTAELGDADSEAQDAGSETGDSGSETGDTDDVDVAAPDCTSDLFCERLESCIEEVCVDRSEADCSLHSECGFGGACADGVCVDRRTVRGEVRLRPVESILGDHFMDYPGRREPFGNGRGAAVLDFDGDGLLDLFIGGIPEVGSESCLYRNVSDEAVAFEMTELCGVLGRVDGASATDLDRDGVHELVTFAFQSVKHWSWDGEVWSLVDLFPLLEEAELGCSAGGGTMLDADRDGDLDLLVHCQHDTSAVPVGYANIVLEVEDGEFVAAWPELRSGALADEGLTLAVLVSDLNDDGLTDIITLDDTFSSNGVINITWEPGGIIWGCDPLEECEWRLTGLGPGSRAWGSFMGAASLRMHSGEELVYVSDLGLDRLVNVASGEPPENESRDRGIAESPRDDSLFTWGVFTEDLDQNGLDDLFVVLGDAISARIASTVDIGHLDRLIMQTTDGLELVERPDFSPETEPVFPGRFCAAVDFNTDGLLEFATTPFIGNVRLESEAPAEWGGLRAALVPTTRVVHQLGARFEIWSDSGWQRRATHGQPRSTSSPFLTVPEGRVRVRFPSGAVVDVFVEGPGPHPLEEPDWLSLESGTDGLSVRIAAEHWFEEVSTVSVAHRTELGTELVVLELVDGAWVSDVTGGAVMLRINERWVERWWPL